MRNGDNAIYGAQRCEDIPVKIIEIGAIKPHSEFPDCITASVQVEVASGERTGEQFICDIGELMGMKEFETILVDPPFWRIYATHLVWENGSKGDITRVIGHLEGFLEHNGLRGEFDKFLHQMYPPVEEGAAVMAG